MLLEEIVDFELGQVLELFAAFGIQHNRRSQVLTTPHHRDHTHILYKSRLLQTIFHFRERYALFLDFHDRIGAALQQETAILVNFHEVSRGKALGFQNVAGLHVEAVVFANAHLADFKRFPDRTILGLPIGNATRLGTAINFHGPVARDAFAFAGHFFRKRSTRRINNRGALKINRLVGIGSQSLEISRARSNHRLFARNTYKFARIVDAVPAERKPSRSRQEHRKQESVNVVVVHRTVDLAVHPVITENLHQFKEFIFKL